MRTASFALASLLLAAPLSASWWPTWNPSDVRLTVGETATVQVKANWSGLVDYGNGIHWTFRSDDDHVATAYVHMETSTQRDVQIVAVGPGTAAIRQDTGFGFESVSWVRITVVCGAEAPAIAATPLLQGRVGEPLTLALVSSIANRTNFTWYLGETGDVSHPLDAAGPQIAFTPATYGTIHVWASAVTPCSASTVQFTIEVPYPRRRTAK